MLCKCITQFGLEIISGVKCNIMYHLIEGCKRLHDFWTVLQLLLMRFHFVGLVSLFSPLHEQILFKKKTEEILFSSL